MYEDNQKKVRLRIRELEYTRATSSASADATFKEVQEKKLEGGVFAHELDVGSSHLIPIPAPLGMSIFSVEVLIYANCLLGGLIVLGETSIKYIDDNANDMISRDLEEATVFVAWEKVDSQRWLLADDYGRLFFLMFYLNAEAMSKTGSSTTWAVHRALRCLCISAEAFSLLARTKVIRRFSVSTMVGLRSFRHCPTLLLFWTSPLMDLGNRDSESHTHEFSTGQARIVTGSGAFDDGTLRSVRSGVGMEELGVLERWITSQISGACSPKVPETSSIRSS